MVLPDASANENIETVNSFSGHWCCINGNYMYGTGADTRRYVLRKLINSHDYQTMANVTLLNSTFEIQNRMYGTTTEGLIFVLVKDDHDVHYLLRSSDGGSTLTNVFTFGENNGPDDTDAPQVRLLRGFIELTRDLPGGGGKGVLLLGEYNISSSRVRGSTNDRVRIMRSDDSGITWSKVVEWNTDGSNQVGHIHAIKQDPYTGEIYICTGDNNYKSGIIKWDGVSEWEDNATLTETGLKEGFEVLTGLQRYRVCDVLFDENYFYTFTDTQLPENSTGSESGIWRGRKDFSSFTRMNNMIFDYDPMHIGWFGEKIGNTFVFTTAREYIDPVNAWKELNTQVFTSADGINWKVAGSINWRDTGDDTRSAYITNMFAHENMIYIDCMGGAGHNSTIACKVVPDPFIDPPVLHPVYYVGTWNSAGNDANNGTSPDFPKRTLGSMLTSDHISAGARVRISAGEFNETTLNPLWSGAFIQGRGSVIIEGKGMDQTSLIWSSEGSNSYGLYIEASRTLSGNNSPLIFKNLEMYHTDNGIPDNNNYIIRNADTYIKTVFCRIGNQFNDDSPLINLESEGARYDSENSIHMASIRPGLFKFIVNAGSSGTQFHFKNCIILNAWDAFTIETAGAGFSLIHCTVYNIDHCGVVLGPSCNVQPVIKNCIFSCGYSPIEDLSGMYETSIDYNLYNTPTINVTDGGHSLDTGLDPQFVDPAGLNFELKEGSPCVMAGTTLTDIAFDFLRRIRSNPPSIGAFEPRTGEIPTTTDDETLTGIRIFPNPVSEMLTINYYDDRYNSVRIINTAGAVVLSEDVVHPLQQFSFSSFRPGVYIIEFAGPGISKRTSLIIHE